MNHTNTLPGVLFDFDGVLANSLESHFLAWEMAVQEILGHMDDLNLRTIYEGHSTLVFGKIIAAKFGQADKSGILVDRKIELLRSGSIHVPLYEGVSECLIRLNEQGIPHGIASNAPRSFIERVLKDNLKNQALPKVILGREDVDRPKPKPDIYLLAAKKLDISITDHQNTVVLEDSVHGLKAARLARMNPIGITTQHESKELITAGATATFPSVASFFAQVQSG